MSENFFTTNLFFLCARMADSKNATDKKKAEKENFVFTESDENEMVNNCIQSEKV